MSLKQDFKELGFELSQILKKDLERIREKAQANLSVIKDETNKKIQKDMVKLENTLTQNARIQINKKVSDLFNSINRNILIAKTNLVEEFLRALTDVVNQHIKDNSKGYFENLNREIEDATKHIQNRVSLYLCARDLKKILSDPKLIQLNSEIVVLKESPSIDTICGFKLIAEDNSFVLDYTYESKLEQMRDEIGRRLMKLFPVFESNVESVIANAEKIVNKWESEKKDVK